MLELASLLDRSAQVQRQQFLCQRLYRMHRLAKLRPRSWLGCERAQSSGGAAWQGKSLPSRLCRVSQRTALPSGARNRDQHQKPATDQETVREKRLKTMLRSHATARIKYFGSPSSYSFEGRNIESMRPIENVKAGAQFANRQQQKPHQRSDRVDSQETDNLHWE